MFGDIVVEDNTFSSIAFDILSTVLDADFEGGSFAREDVTIRHNDFTAPNLGGSKVIYNDMVGSSVDLNAEDNWWGDTDGPTHSGNTFNVSGQGSLVDDNVDYVPWYDTDMAGTSFAPVKNTTDSTKFSSIQAAIDASTTANGETITAVAGTYTEDLAINKELTLTGRNLADTANAWTALTAGASAVSPTITYDSVHAHMIGIDADNVTIQGFTIDLVNVASRGIHFRSQGAGTIASPTIQYNTFLHGTSSDRAISISDDRIVNDFTITYNVFTGDVSAMGNWVAIGEDAGCSGANVISYNITTDLTNAPLLLGSRNIYDITFSNNTLSRSIYLSGEQTPLAYFGDIVVERNTFSFIAVDILSSVANTHFEGGAFDALDVIVNYNAFPTDTVLGTKAIFNDMTGASVDLDAWYNYWGAATGPDDDGDKNPYYVQADTADAAKVTTGVDFIPWMIHADLVSGWNIWSTPIASGTATNTITEALDLLWTSGTTDSTKFVIGYYFDSSASPQEWVEVTLATSVTPLQAVYLNMSAAATIDVCISTSYTAPPSQTAYAGWNLIGLAELYSMDAEDALASAYYVAGANNIGYSQVVSPGLGQTVWSAMRGALIDTASNQLMLPTEGYWVNMVNQGTLAGFTSTPITELP